MTFTECKRRTHIRCSRVSPKEYAQLQQKPSYTWYCMNCLFSFLPGYDDEASSEDVNIIDINLDLQVLGHDIIDYCKDNHHDFMIAHLNINSVQNKLNDLKLLNRELKSQVIFLSETKIDSSYKDDQFSIRGYNMFRKDRKKGGGGLMGFISTNIASKKVSAPANRHVEVLPIEIKTTSSTILLVGVYRPPKAVRNDNFSKLEDELSSLCMWAELQKQTVILMGDLNLNQMDTNKREGKLLIDLEESFNLTCLINSPTRITNVLSTLIDVMLTNRPDYFIKSGTFDPEISDHCLIYGILNEKTIHYKPKTIMSRNLKSITFEPIAEELTNAPWQVGEVFNDIYDRVDYWNGLVRYVVDAHAPLRKKRVWEIDVPYMTLNWKNAIRRKRKYAQLYAKKQNC